MIKIYIKKQSNYPVSATKLKRKLKAFLERSGIVSDAQVNVVLVGEKKMQDVGKRYLGDNQVHNVLSFTEDELTKEFVYPPDDIIRLGEIVVCYPLALEEAKREGVLIENKVYALIEHGAKHLLGEHHK